MKLEWNKKSWHARLYRNTYYVCDMPDNICEYWWKLLLAIVLFIPCWPGHLLNYTDDKWKIGHGAEGKTVWWWLHIPVVLILTILWMDTIYGKPEHWAHWVKVWGWYPIGIAVGLGASIIFIGVLFLIAGIMYLTENVKWNKKTDRKASPVTEGFKAWKDKYCAKITWK